LEIMEEQTKNEQKESAINLVRARFYAEVASNLATKSLSDLAMGVTQELKTHSGDITKEVKDEFSKMNEQQIGAEIKQLSNYGFQAAQLAVWDEEKGVTEGIDASFMNFNTKKEELFGVLFMAAIPDKIQFKREPDQRWYKFADLVNPTLKGEARESHLKSIDEWEKYNPVVARMKSPMDMGEFNEAVKSCMTRINEIFSQPGKNWWN